ncbi:hypothetical protein C818_02599 [Lachnospiraceae bacterium MD308]|nr:hypothetical protein C818_02599 [Lachnospiraceae bacterium MD308]
MKKLLIISLHADPSMPPGVGEWGGTHTYMRELLTELHDTDYDVILITRKVYPTEETIERISPSCRIVRLTLGVFGDFDKRDLYKLHEVTFSQLIEKLNELKFVPDIIHSVYWNSGHLAMRLSNLWNIPYVHSVISNGKGRNEHGATGTASHRIYTETQVFTHASLILCVAESEKAEICKYYNIQPSKVVVAGQYIHPAFVSAAHDPIGAPRKSGISHKIESVYFSPYVKTQITTGEWWRKQVFTYTGRLSVDKGISFIVQAWHHLQQKYNETCPPLWIIGGNPTDIENIRSQLELSESELSRLENNRQIVWWGFLDENGISAIYGKTLALITHSKYEPGGRVAVEAMCEGVPVLATPNGFALDTIQNWANGFLIPYGDIPTLEVRMEHFIKQPYLSNCMGQQARKTGLDTLKYWNFRDKHLAAYTVAIEGNIFKETPYIKTELNPNFRIPVTYPFNMYLVDKPDILQIMHNNAITDIISIINCSNSSSASWSVECSNKNYFIKIPYDRINNSALWSENEEQPTVISSLKRYRAEVGATTFHGIPPLLGKHEPRHALIREKYENVELPLEQQLSHVLHAINSFYEKNPLSNSKYMENLNKLIQQGKNYHEVDSIYQEMVSSDYPWQYYYNDYSLRIELLRWNHYYDLLSPVQQEPIRSTYPKVFQLANTLSLGESNLQPVLNHGGFDYKNLIFTPQPILLDNEKIHPGWPGIDYADFILTFVAKRYVSKETKHLWESILKLVPTPYITNSILGGWLLLGICKELVSEAARLNPISASLKKRSDILLQIFQ